MSDKQFLKGRKILITSYSYADFGGAELNAVELAEQLVEFGAEPTFFSYDIEGPLRDYIEKKFNTKVLTDQINKLSETDTVADMGVTELNIDEYDYVWVGGNTVPISIMKQINSARKLPKFVFIHMSPLVGFPLDAPLMPEFEKNIASAILSIGRSTSVDGIRRILGANVPIDEWPNPVPSEFSEVPGRSGKLNRIAVISSSHPSDEVMNIRKPIEDQGITIDYIGKFNNNMQVVNAKFYDKYDLIIGIGKNARYSLVSGVPIYVYGRFGGCGYINKDNVSFCEESNFSGRGFKKKNSDTIVKEILTGYGLAQEFHSKYRAKYMDKLSIDRVAKNLFVKLEQKDNKKHKFDELYINWLVSMQVNLMQRHMRTRWLRRAEKRIDRLESEMANQALDIKKLNEDMHHLKTTRNKLRTELHNVTNSVSWRVTIPLRLIGSWVRAVKNSGAVKNG